MYTSLTNTYDIDNNGILKIYLDHAGISSVLKRTTEKDMIEIVISNSEYDSNISYRFYAGMLDRDMATINLIKGDKVHISCYNDRDYPIPEERSPFVTFFEHFVDEDIKDKKYQSSDKTLSYNRDYVMADYNYPIDGYLYIDDNYIYFKRETRIVFKETDFSGFLIVGIAFIEALTTNSSPFVIPPSIPPALFVFLVYLPFSK